MPCGRLVTFLKGCVNFYDCFLPMSTLFSTCRSRDSTVRLWNRSRRKRSTDTSDHVVLPHDVDSAGFPTDTYADVTALEWNVSIFHANFSARIVVWFVIQLSVGRKILLLLSSQISADRWPPTLTTSQFQCGWFFSSNIPLMFLPSSYHLLSLSVFSLIN